MTETSKAAVCKVKDFHFGLIYVDDLDEALNFYKKYFGFETKFTMDDEKSHYGSIGGIDIWIGSGYDKKPADNNDTRATMMLDIDSVSNLFNTLKEDGFEVMQDKPIEMQEGIFWLQFRDPAGNILEVLGGE